MPSPVQFCGIRVFFEKLCRQFCNYFGDQPWNQLSNEPVTPPPPTLSPPPPPGMGIGSSLPSPTQFCGIRIFIGRFCRRFFNHSGTTSTIGPTIIGSIFIGRSRDTVQEGPHGSRGAPRLALGGVWRPGTMQWGAHIVPVEYYSTTALFSAGAMARYESHPTIGDEIFGRKVCQRRLRSPSVEL